MRTIKFRGKRYDNGEWAFGDLHTHDVIEIIVRISYRREDYYAVVQDTVGQFTGLQDKNGKDIYEGDILEFVDEKGKVYRRAVVYNEGAFCQEISFDWLKLAYNPLKNHQLELWEVIGNIHDNPELLKGDKQ